MSQRPALGVTGGWLALFADCLLTGVLTALAALGVVTAFPALAAGCAVLRSRAYEDRSVGPRRYLLLFVAALRTGVLGLLVPVAVVAVLVADGLAVAAGVPGAVPLGVLLAVATAAAVVLGLRTAAAWRPGERWPAVTRRAARAAPRDPGGSALLLLAGVVTVALVVTVPLTVVLVAGPLALAAVAVDACHPPRRPC